MHSWLRVGPPYPGTARQLGANGRSGVEERKLRSRVRNLQSCRAKVNEVRASCNQVFLANVTTQANHGSDTGRRSRRGRTQANTHKAVPVRSVFTA